MNAIVLTGEVLTAREVEDAALRRRPVRLDPAARGRMAKSRALVEEAVRAKRIVYGVNTGFGDLADTTIGEEDLARLQQNLIRSHASGVGEPLDPPAVRAILVAKANSLAKGLDGVRPEIAEFLLALLDRDLLPVLPSIGSVGASGDLAPLAHLSLVLVGEGETTWKGERMASAAGLRLAGLRPIVLAAKEGLGLINGTQGIGGILALAAASLDNTIEHAVLAAALSTDALRGTDEAFDPLLFRARPHPGGRRVAAMLRALLEGSAIRESHRGIPKTQDAYSIRCTPAVLGAAAEALQSVRRTLEIELNSATGNPLCFPDEGRILSGGNFHGEPVAMAADFLAIAAAEVGSIAERRVARLVDAKVSGLPPFLASDPGLHSGYMVAQYTAAALVSENKVLAHPASVDSIPTSAGQEDHVSMGFHGARKARAAAENAKRTVAIELLVAAEGIERLRPLRSSAPLEGALARIRAAVPPLGEDRPPGPDIERLVRLIDEGILREGLPRPAPEEE